MARAKLLENIESTIIDTKVNDLKKKINDVESMKINPVTTVIIGKDDDEDDEDSDNKIDLIDGEADFNIADNDLVNIQRIKDEMDDDSLESTDNEDGEESIVEKSPEEQEKEDLINNYLRGFDEELNRNSSKKNKSDSIDESDLIENEETNSLSIDEDLSEDIKIEPLSIEDDMDNEDRESSSINHDLSVDEESEDNHSNKNATIVDLFEDDEDEEDEFDKNLSKNSKKSSNNSNIPKKDNNDKKNEVINPINKDKKDNGKKSQFSKKENKHKEEKTNIPIKEHKNKDIKANSSHQNKTKFNSSKENISSKFDENSNVKETIGKDVSSDKSNVYEGEFKVKEKNQASKKRQNSPKINKNNENNRAKSLMSRLRNIGEEVVNNIQNIDSQDVKKPKKTSKEIQIKSDDSLNEKKEIKSDIESQDEIEIKSDDFKKDESNSNVSDNQNLYEEEEINIIDEELDNNLEFSLEENEKLEDMAEFSLEEDLEDISEDIIREINEEDLENKDSKGIENMNEYRTPKRKKNEIIDDSPDVIVPISAEIRKNNQNHFDDEDSDYISPINEEYGEYEEFYEEDGLDDLINETVKESVADYSIGEVQYSKDHAESNSNDLHDSNDPESPYYYSAVGIENALKKNAVQYPRNNDRNKTGLAGTVNSLKNEMLYLKASMDEIENPTQREMVYVIDRNADDEFFEDPYDPYQETVVVENRPKSDDEAYESLFTSKKHEYLDKIEEYTNSSSSDTYSDGSIGDTILDELSNDYLDDSEPIIPINSEINDYDDEFVHIDDSRLDSDDDFIHIDDIGLDSSLEDSFEDIGIDANTDNSFEDIEIDDDQFEDIITDVGHDYQELEEERIREANVLSAVDNTRLTPTGKLSDYIEDYTEIEDLIIKSPAEIYEDEMKLATAIMDIVAAEGPVHVDTVVRRFRESCGLSRAGTKFKNTILETIDRNEAHLLLIREKDFLFIDYDSIKVRKRVKPNIDLISEVEIEKAIDLVLSFEKSLKVPELAKNVSRAFGFRSTSKKTSSKITLVIDSMIGKGVLINNNGKIEFR